MSPTTPIVSAICALVAAGGGMWFQYESHQKFAGEEFHKVQDKVRMLEALVASAAMKAHLTQPEVVTPPPFGRTEPEEAWHGGVANFLAVHKILVVFGIASVLLLAAGFARFFFRPVLVKVKGTGALTIRVVRALNLPNLDANAKKKDDKDVTDAYVEVKVHGTSKKTKTVKDSLSPNWDEAVGPFELDFDAKQQLAEPGVIINVWDYDGYFHSDSFVGGLKLNSQELVANVLKKNAGKDAGEPLEAFAQEYQLQDVPELAVHDAQKHEPAKLTIEVTWAPHKTGVSKTGASKPGEVKRGKAPEGQKGCITQ